MGRLKRSESEADKADWAVIKQWSLSVGYSPYKSTSSNRVPTGTLVVVHSQSSNQDTPDTGESVLLSYAPALRAILVEHATSYPLPPLILVLDLSQIVSDEKIDQETMMMEFTKSGIGKATARALEKLGLERSTVVTTGKACSLFMKLLITGERLKPNNISRLVMVHPDITTETINGILVRRGGKVKGYGNALDVDVIFDSEKIMDKRLSIIRTSFPKGRSRVMNASFLDLLVPAITEEGLSVSLAVEGPFDPFHIDSMGRQLWFGELSVAMSPFSKQYEHTSEDISPEIQEAWRSPAEAATANLDNSYITVDAPPLAGALVLRGNRCVLVRSLSDPPEWNGMCFPAVKRAESESIIDAATHAMDAMCDIESDEVLPLEDVPPVMVYGNGRPYGKVLLHLFSAVNPPPPGPLENADMEDEDDLYDWYTYPRAMEALPDDASRLALYTVAMALNAAAASNKVPMKWLKSEGGVFGQELFEGKGLQLASSFSAIAATASTSATAAPTTAAPATDQDPAINADLSEMSEDARSSYLAEVDAYKQSMPTSCGFPEHEHEQDEDMPNVEWIDKMEEEDKEEAMKQERVRKEGSDEAEIVIIGASASGLGVATAILTALDLPLDDVRILEASPAVGASFRAWPPSTRFISPSFYSNPFNQMDLNSLAPQGDNGVQAFLRSQGKDIMDAQHPTGKEYADYLDHFASTPGGKNGDKTLKDYISFNSKVESIEPIENNAKGNFKISLTESSPFPTIYARYVIYAGGEYGHPYLPPFARDSPACNHYSKVKDWGVDANGDWVVVGGGEAGIDSACSLYDNIKSGTITVIDKESAPEAIRPGEVVEDPSTALSPRTHARLKAILKSKHFPEKTIKVISEHECVDVSKKGKTYTASISKLGGKKKAPKTDLKANHPIIMATGFKLGASPNCILNGLVEYDKTGRPKLDPQCDMSTKTENLFVCGPMVKHQVTGCGGDAGEEKKDGDDKANSKKAKKVVEVVEEKKDEEVIFCFVYKYRCRFALVAGKILAGYIKEYHVKDGKVDEGGKLAVAQTTAMMDLYKEKGMLITSLEGAVCGKVGACGASC